MAVILSKQNAAHFLLVLLFVFAISSLGFSQQLSDRPTDRPSEALGRFGRKLLDQANATTTVRPARIGLGQCSPDDIIVIQKATGPLPNGIPTYTAHVLNECVGGSECDIGNIHLACGLFSSARLVNPKIFRRLQPNDCLVNDGKPIAGGQSVSFQYANTFSFPLSVSSAECPST